MLRLSTCTVLGAVIAWGPAGWADTADEAAEAISDVSYYGMPAGTLGLMTLGCPRDKQVGRRMADAGIAAALVSELLKVTTDQGRPNDHDADDGFPSGHAAGAWALAEAASMENHKVRPYAYAAAAAVTWSRVQTRDHSVWQALAGAALGYAAGHLSGSTRGGIFHGLIVKGRAGRRRAKAEGAARQPVAVPAPAMVGDEAPKRRVARPVIELWRAEW
jgi:membrane-associated phospholipid phosphatase